MELKEIIRILPNYDPYLHAEDCIFDETAALKAINFIERHCSLSKSCFSGEMGKKFVLQDFQKAIIANLFGWFRPNGTRRYRECLIYLPRGNGKSELAAAIIDYVGFCGNEGSAEIYSCAGDAKQARIIFDAVKNMINGNPLLASKVKGKMLQYSIEFPKQSFYRYLSSSADTKHGQSVSLAILDELHVFQDRNLVDTMSSSRRSRKNPLIIYTTTADWDRESICNEIHLRAKQCQNAKNKEDVGYNPYFLPVIYEAARDADWQSLEVIRSVNPNYGVSVSPEYLQEELRKAIDTPSLQSSFRRLHLNQKTESHEAWLTSKDWALCSGLPFDVEQLIGKDCYASIDFSSNQDFTCVMLYFPEFKVFLPHFFIPKDNAEQRERHCKVPLRIWEQKGFLTMTDGNVIDDEFLLAYIIGIKDKYKIKTIAYDPFLACKHALALQKEGFEVKEFRQGTWSMAEPSKEFERLVMKHEIRHLDNPVLKWMAMNVTIEKDPTGLLIKPSKRHSEEKIDGIVCAVMCIGLALVEQDNSSIYSDPKTEIIFA